MDNSLDELGGQLQKWRFFGVRHDDGRDRRRMKGVYVENMVNSHQVGHLISK